MRFQFCWPFARMFCEIVVCIFLLCCHAGFPPFPGESAQLAVSKGTTRTRGAEETAKIAYVPIGLGGQPRVLSVQVVPRNYFPDCILSD